MGRGDQRASTLERKLLHKRSENERWIERGRYFEGNVVVRDSQARAQHARTDRLSMDGWMGDRRRDERGETAASYLTNEQPLDRWLAYCAFLVAAAGFLEAAA